MIMMKNGFKPRKFLFTNTKIQTLDITFKLQLLKHQNHSFSQYRSLLEFFLKGVFRHIDPPFLVTWFVRVFEWLFVSYSFTLIVSLHFCFRCSWQVSGSFLSPHRGDLITYIDPNLIRNQQTFSVHSHLLYKRLSFALSQVSISLFLCALMNLTTI